MSRWTISPDRAGLVMLLWIGWGTGALAADGLPLHERIDQLVERESKASLPPLADDAEFLRRAFLDFQGTIPPVQEAREFLADKSQSKRTKLIDRLLREPDYARRMRELLNIMLMERLGTSADWDKYLEESFATNKPWDQLTREILAGDSSDPKLRGSAFFYTKRLENYGQNPVDKDGLARDIGRLFLGVDLQCANCHSHLFIKDYKQQDYKGLFAFIANTSLQQIGGRPGLVETAMDKKLEYSSVFESGRKATGPKLPGDKEIDVPAVKKGEEFAVPPDPKKEQPGVLKFSPRRLLAERLPRPENGAFKKNIANRLWWVMMGRGLVEPLDLHHSENPPSHPELLNLLAEEFAATKFDVKALLRELALTRTYQRSSVMPAMPRGQQPSRESFLVFHEKGLSAEQLARAVMQATGSRSSEPSRTEGATSGAAKTTDPVADALAAFQNAFANPPREPETEFRSSVKAALFISNSKLVIGWLEPKNGNLTDRLSKISDANQLAEELYLSILTRRPTADESAAVAAYLATRADSRPQAIKNLAWSLLASTEFCVNH
jgi:hypothetical protein